MSFTAKGSECFKILRVCGTGCRCSPYNGANGIALVSDRREFGPCCLLFMTPFTRLMAWSSLAQRYSA